MSKPYTLSLRIAHDLDVPLVYNILENMFDEGPLEALNGDKARLEIERVIKEAVCWLVFKNVTIQVDGQDVTSTVLVGTGALVQAEFWYSDTKVAAQRWLYVLPEHRGDDDAWGLLKKEIADFCEESGVTAYLDIHNQLKGRKRSRIEAAFIRFLYQPRGVTLRVMPAQEEAA